MNIIITGASKGIGYATARAFLSLPAHRVAVISRHEAPMKTLAEDAHPESRVVPYAFDLTEDTEGLVSRLRKDLDRVDILIHNAGYLIKKPFSDLVREDYLRSLEVNFLAPVMLTRALLPLLERSEIRHVVNISSMAGFQGSVKFPGLAAYAASKAALNNLTEVLAAELQERGIRVNALAPGTVDTGMLQQAFPGYKAPVTPEEMGHFICTFATTAWKVINGQVIPVTLSTP